MESRRHCFAALWKESNHHGRKAALSEAEAIATARFFA